SSDVCSSDLDYRKNGYSEGSIVNSVVLASLSFQEGHRALQLVETVQTIFDRDPAGESCAGEDAKNGAVIDQASTRFAVFQLVGVAERPVGLTELLHRGALGQIAIGGVHRDDARQNLFEKANRVVAAHER